MGLDAAMGVSTPPLLYEDEHANLLRERVVRRYKLTVSASPSRVLQVLFAERNSWHGRHLTNMQALVSGCAERKVAGWTLHCRARSLGAMPLRQMIALMRRVDVFVSMHGADVINGLHMLPGRAIFEVVNYGFHLAPSGPPFHFLNCFRLLSVPVYAHKRLVLGRTDSWAPSWQSDWNANGTLEWPLLERALLSVVAERRDEWLFFGRDNPQLRPNSLEVGNLSAALVGYCAQTTEGWGDCARGSQGSVALGPKMQTLAECAAECVACDRCNFVSFSKTNQDCSCARGSPPPPRRLASPRAHPTAPPSPTPSHHPRPRRVQHVRPRQPGPSLWGRVVRRAGGLNERAPGTRPLERLPPVCRPRSSEGDPPNASPAAVARRYKTVRLGNDGAGKQPADGPLAAVLAQAAATRMRRASQQSQAAKMRRGKLHAVAPPSAALPPPPSQPPPRP